MPSNTAASAPPFAGRDLRFDTIRGALLLVMAINHVGSDLSVALNQPLGFVSAAEGFVFLSGIQTGRIDHPAGDNFDVLASRARRRAARAYLWHVFGLVAVWVWVRAWLAFEQPTPWSLPFLFHQGDGLTGLFGGLLLLYQPGLLDILPMYAGFPLLAPLVLRFHNRGHGLAVWLVSGAIWAADQLFAPGHPVIWGPINTGAFHFLSWQWLFVSGVLLGAEPRWERQAIHRPGQWTLLTALAGAVFLLCLRHSTIWNWWDAQTLAALTEKTPLAILRLLDFALLAYLLAVIGCRHPGWLVLRPFAILGRHSLPVFTTSILCAQLALCYPELDTTPQSRWLKTGFVLLGCLAAALACELYRNGSERTRIWNRHLARRNPPGPRESRRE